MKSTTDRTTINAASEAVVSIRVAEKSMQTAAVNVEALSRFNSHSPEVNELYGVPKIGSTEMVAVIALAHTGNFTQTAATLGYSQPGVTRQIQRAEESYGKLFNRTHNPVTVTSNGAIVIEAFMQALTALSAAAASQVAD